MNESNIMRRQLVRLSQLPGVRAWRINVGFAWVGEVAGKTAEFITLRNYRPFKTGVPPGFSDIVGLRSITVTQDMVGAKLAVFTVIESKTSKGKTASAQDSFLSMVKSLGGIAGVARSEDEAAQIVMGWRPIAPSHDLASGPVQH